MSADQLTADRLRLLLSYEAATGLLRRKTKAAPRIQIGEVAGVLDGRGYLAITIDYRMYRAHRLAWLHEYGTWPTGQIDHINGIRSDNRLCNLRDVTASVNQQNKRRAMSNNTTGLLGVSPYGNRWSAKIVYSGKQRRIGTFATPELAHAAYIAAKRELHEGNTI